MKKGKIALFLASLLAIGGLSGCSLFESLFPTTEQPSQETKPSDKTDGKDDDKKDDEGKEDETIDSASVLFLGNSLMFFNDMPQMFEEMATIAGKGCIVDSVTQGSATISLFADETTDMGRQARRKISEGFWDYIIIEPSRRATPWENTVVEAEIEAAKVIQGLADEIDAKIMLYTVWGNNTGNLDIYTQTGASTSTKTGNQAISRKAHTKFMHEFNEQVSEELGGVPMIEAGYAFENALAEDPTVDLYYSDQKHPSLAGSYLAGLTVFGTIFKESNEFMSYDKGLASASFLKEIANKTCLENLVPNLDDEGGGSTDSADFNLLCVGSNFMSDYSVGKMFTELSLKADNTKVNVEWVLNGAYTNGIAANPSNSFGKEFRTAFASKEWDAVVFQLTRRCTMGADDVETKEKAALLSIKEELFSGTDAPKMYVYTMQSGDNPAIFYDNGTDSYAKTGANATYTAKQGTQYFEEVAYEWAQELGTQPVLYGSAFVDYSETYSIGLSDVSNAEKGYLKACCLYNALFEKAIPETCDYYYNLTAVQGQNIREICAEHCLA